MEYAVTAKNQKYNEVVENILKIFNFGFHAVYDTTTSDDVKNGTTYLSVMQSNLDVLKQALQ